MKLTSTAVISLVGLGVAAPAFAEGPLALGSKAPMATAKLTSAVDGKETSISKVAGSKGTLVVFTCNGCPYANKWEERIVELGNSYSKKGIGVIAINANDPAVARVDTLEVTQKRAKDRGFQFPYAIDATSNVARAFGARVTPEAFLFDKGGKLVYHGTVDDNSDKPDQVQKKYLKDALDAVLTNKMVPAAETKALGCGIKFRGNS